MEMSQKNPLICILCTNKYILLGDSAGRLEVQGQPGQLNETLSQKVKTRPRIA